MLKVYGAVICDACRQFFRNSLPDAICELCCDRTTASVTGSTVLSTRKPAESVNTAAIRNVWQLAWVMTDHSKIMGRIELKKKTSFYSLWSALVVCLRVVGVCKIVLFRFYLFI